MLNECTLTVKRCSKNRLSRGGLRGDARGRASESGMVPEYLSVVIELLRA
jgi:hypothetical protein